MSERRVTVYMRIEGHDEAPIGSARSMADVPKLLRLVADRWDAGLRPDALEPPPRPDVRP